MKAILCVALILCVTLAYASAFPAVEDVENTPGQPAVAVAADDDVLEGAEQRWGGRGWGGGGRGWGGGRGYGGGWGGGRGYGGGWGGGRGYGGGWGGGRGYGGGWGGGWGR